MDFYNTIIKCRILLQILLLLLSISIIVQSFQLGSGNNDFFKNQIYEYGNKLSSSSSSSSYQFFPSKRMMMKFQDTDVDASKSKRLMNTLCVSSNDNSILDQKIQLDPVLQYNILKEFKEKRKNLHIGKFKFQFADNKGNNKMKILQDFQKENCTFIKNHDSIIMRVSVSSSLRKILKLKRRHKSLRLFLNKNHTSLNSLDSLQRLIYNTFPIEGIPHDLVFKSNPFIGNSSNLNLSKNFSTILESDTDLKNAVTLALHYHEKVSARQNENCKLKLSIDLNSEKQASLMPGYLRDLPDPAKSVSMQIFSFFSFFNISNPERYAMSLRATWSIFKAHGRIYVAKEGINAQMAIPTNIFSNFKLALQSLQGLHNISLNIDKEITLEEYRRIKPFNGLHIRVRDQVLVDGLKDNYNWNDCGYAMNSVEWHRILETMENSSTVLLDCRNVYESKVGIFEGAKALNTSVFTESFQVIDKQLKDCPKDQHIMTYCTGGIRCVKIGAYIKQKLGFRNVNRLEGGIISYARYIKEQKVSKIVSKFKGVNFVFDNRLGETVTQDVLSQCDTCGANANKHINCANNNCHLLFVQCEQCSSYYNHCCSSGCRDQLINPIIGQGREINRWLNPTFKSVKMNRKLDNVLVKYFNESCKQEAGYLKDLREETNQLLPSSTSMCSGYEQSKLLSIITSSVKASRILELGTHTGYSALTFAESIPDDGTVTCCGIDKAAYDIAQRHFRKVDHGIKINMSFQPAMSLLQDLVNNQSQELEPFDIIFIDADKKSYIDYYNFIVENKLLSPNGLMIVDNVLWKGLVTKLSSDKERLAKMQEEVKNSDKSTRRKFELAKVMHNFLTHVKSDNRVDMAILPFRDGIGFIRWL